MHDFFTDVTLALWYNMLGFVPCAINTARYFDVGDEPPQG
jgi:hypothetical protein